MKKKRHMSAMMKRLGVKEKSAAELLLDNQDSFATMSETKEAAQELADDKEQTKNAFKRTTFTKFSKDDAMDSMMNKIPNQLTELKKKNKIPRIQINQALANRAKNHSVTVLPPPNLLQKPIDETAER